MSVVEFLLVCAGLGLPTLAFTARFAINESFAAAFVDASQAWWQVLVDRQFVPMAQQHVFLGLDQPWAHALVVAGPAGRALVAIGAIWAAGWIANWPWRPVVRGVMVIAAGALVYYFRPEPGVAAGGWANGWLYVGSCLPGMMALVFC